MKLVNTEYLQTPDGRIWVCIETTIEALQDRQENGDDDIARWFEAMLILARESRPDFD